MVKKYVKPQIKSEKIKLNFFMQQSRYIDSADLLSSTRLLAQGSGSSGTSSGSSLSTTGGSTVGSFF